MDKTIGQVAYEASLTKGGFKSLVDKKEQKTWDKLTKEEQAKWEATAKKEAEAKAKEIELADPRDPNYKPSPTQDLGANPKTTQPAIMGKHVTGYPGIVEPIRAEEAIPGGVHVNVSVPAVPPPQNVEARDPGLSEEQKRVQGSPERTLPVIGDKTTPRIRGFSET